MVPFIDTHCHLDLFKNIRDNVKYEDELEIKTITVTNAPFLLEHNELLFKECRNIRVGLGLHPELVAKYGYELNLFEFLCVTTKYIGEIGLDGSAIYRGLWGQQLIIFRQILKILSKVDRKILTIHSRNAASVTIEELHKELKDTDHRIILHWFSGTIKELDLAVKVGYYFSINHKMISTKKGIDLINAMPQERILTETDAPFTFDASITTREKSIRLTVKQLSLLWHIPFQEAKKKIYDNFRILLN